MKYSGFFKRTQTWILAIAMILSVVSPTFGIMAAEADPTVTLNVGKVVADNYELTDAEKALIGSGLLVGDEITVAKPSAAEDLISVDTDAKEITVDKYEDGDYVWVPVSADIVVGSETVETVTLDENGSAAYAYDGNAFSVVANYELSITVDEEIQNLLLNAPAYIKEGLDNMAEIAKLESSLAVIQEAMPEFVKLAGDGIWVSVFGQSMRVYFNTDEAKYATNVLNQQMTDNGGKLDLAVMIEAYNSATSKTQYLVENGAELKMTAEETLALLNDLMTATFFSMIDALDATEYALLHAVLSNINSTIKALNDVLANPWTITTVDAVRDGLTADGYALLDLYASAITKTTDISKIEVKNPLLAATASVRLNMSMYDVTVKVVLNVTDPSTGIVGEKATVSTVVTLAEGATAEEIIAAIQDDGIEADALANWTNEGLYVDGKFEAETTELGDSLTEDIEYVVTYTPKTFTVRTYVDGQILGTMDYHYGYKLVLAKHSESGVAYDYIISDDNNAAGVYYPQGSTYIVTCDATIERSEGKSYTSGNLYQIIADNYFTSDKGADILTSGALYNNVEVNVRYPDNNNKIVSLSGSTLTALEYASSYNNLSWKPYSYKLDNGTVGYFNGMTSVEISEYFDMVTVTYRLDLTNFDLEDILAIVNLPAELSDEAKAQLAALGRITGQEKNLETLNRSMILALNGIISEGGLNDDPAKDAALVECFSTVLNSIKDECMSGNNLYLYELVAEYNLQADGLRYYYQNHEKIRSEISKFAGYMTKMLGDDETLTSEDKINALAKLMESANFDPEQYLSKLTTLETTMNQVVADLSAPNAVIDVNSANLGKLTAALQSAGNVETFESISYVPYLSDDTINVTADNKVVVTVVLNIGGKNYTVSSDILNAADAVPAAAIEKLISDIETVLSEQGIDSKYYETAYNAVVFEALIGVKASEIVNKYEYSWTAKKFEVEIEGSDESAETPVVDVENLEIELPASKDPAYRYDYYVDGVKVSGSTYTLTVEQLDKLIAGELVIKVESVYVLQDDLIGYINHLNESVGDDNIVFALVKDANGDFTVVMKVDASAPNTLMSSAKGFAEGMVMGAKYSYVGIDGKMFLGESDGALKLHLQTIVDALMNSGFGTQTIIDVMDANGNINNITIEGTVLSDKVLTTYGGKLMETTIQLGNSADDVTEVPFYVTLGGAPAQLTQVRNLLANQLKGKFEVVCKNGIATVTLDLPEKLYEAYLAALLVTGEIDFNNISDVNGEIALNFIKEHVDPLLAGEVTLETFENTLAKFGYNLDLSSVQGAQTLYNMLVDFYTNASFIYNDKGGVMSSTLDISAIVDSMNLGSLDNVIAEKETGIDLSIGATVKDLGKDYEALYIDIKASGITNKAGLTNDLSGKLDDIAGASVIVLLGDVEGDLTFNTTTLLNLNGNTVNGNINGNGKVIIVDGHVGDDNAGGVTGNVSGDVHIVSGKYESDVSAFIKNGYVQDENGVVYNKFYDIVKDSEGNINIELNAGLIYTESMPSIAALAADIACDLVFNGYTSNYLAIDGCTVYDITIEDLVGIYAGTDRLNTILDEALGMVDSAQLTTLVNTVLDDILDFTAIGEAIENDEPVLSYEMTTKPWDVQFAHNTEGDYITVDITSGEAADRTLNIIIVGNDEDKALLADLMKELGSTTDADINVNISHGREDSNIYVDASADANIYADFSANPNYAIMFSVIIADGIGAPANADLVAGIRNYYETNNLAVLRAAFNSLTTQQVITALKNFNLADEFSAMVSNLGLDDVVANKVAELEALYDRVGKIAAAVVRKADLVGGGRTLGSFLDADGAYGMSRANIERILNANLFKGYTASADIALADLYLGVRLFDKDIVPLDPEFVDGTGTPEILESSLVAGYEIDFDGMYIIIDGAEFGITVEELEEILVLYANNADEINLVFGNGDLDAKALVANGTKLTAIASNKLSDNTDSVEYTIIILGDTNCDGETNVMDSVLISRYLVELLDENGNPALAGEEQILAADINRNGGVDIGDAAKIANKSINWENYVSLIEKKDEEESEA